MSVRVGCFDLDKGYLRSQAKLASMGMSTSQGDMDWLWIILLSALSKAGMMFAMRPLPLRCCLWGMPALLAHVLPSAAISLITAVNFLTIDDFQLVHFFLGRMWRLLQVQIAWRDTIDVFIDDLNIYSHVPEAAYYWRYQLIIVAACLFSDYS